MLPYNQRLKTKARSLRTNPSDAELQLWQRLRRKQILAVQFYRQKPIGKYIADFYAPAARLVVELDGAQHLKAGQAQYDAQRTKYLERLGLKVLRFDDREVLLQMDCVLEAIFQAAEKSLQPPFAKGRNRPTKCHLGATPLLPPSTPLTTRRRDRFF